MIGVVRDLGRLQQISAVLMRHGFGEIALRLGLRRGADAGEAPVPDSEAERRTSSLPMRLRLVLQDLGPTFVKLGQILSTRADLLPPELIAELKKLQEEVRPVPFADIQSQVEEGLAAPLSERFLRFEERPLAAASIGQVHRAALATVDGEREVVVKVQRPGIGETVARDLDLLRRLAAALERAVPETRVYSPVGLVEHFDRSITAELDFNVEAEHAERFAQNFAGVAGVRFPRVYRQASARRVLTLEFFDGLKLDAALAAGYSGPRLARQAVGIVIKMAFEDGFFHADPHPGNILVLGTPEEPVIGLIDLGMVGRFGPELRDRTIDLLAAAARRDTVAMADALCAIGQPRGKVDMRAFRAEVALLADRYLGRPLKEIELSSLVRDLVQGAIKYGIEIPPDFLLLGKALMTIEGIGKQLDPELDVMGEATPYFVALLKRRYSPRRIGIELLRGIEQLGRAGYDMPMQLREVLEDLRMGRLQVRATDPELPAAADRLGRRLFSGILSASLLIGGALVLAGGRHDLEGQVLLGGGLLLALLHLLRDLRR